MAEAESSRVAEGSTSSPQVQANEGGRHKHNRRATLAQKNGGFAWCVVQMCDQIMSEGSGKNLETMGIWDYGL